MIITKKKIHGFCFLVLILLLVGVSVSAQKRSRFVSVSGKNFITPDGKALALKGIGLGNWLLPEGYMFEFKKASSPQLIYAMVNQLIGETEGRKFWKQFRDNYITQEDIKFIKSAGFNCIRVPFNYRLFVSENDPNKLEGVGYEYLDKVISWSKKESLYVVLDMHGAPGGQTGDNIDDSFGYPFLFENPEDQELTARLWQKLAQRYRNETIVLGYELLNEPIATYFDKDHFNPKLEPLYRKIVSAIREVDKNHVIILGGAQWNTNFKVFGKPFDPKLAYTFHKYGSPASQASIQEYVDFGNKYNVPIWMGEGGENNDEWIRSNRLLFEKNELGWCFWTYKRLNANATIASIKKPETWDDIVMFSENPRSGFDEIRKSRPPKERVEKALQDYVEQIKLKNCRINDGYLIALGLK